MSSPPWQDRRFMFMTGKEVREPSRKASLSMDKAAAAAAAEAAKAPTPASPTSPASASTTASAVAAGPGTSPVQGRRRSSASSQGGIFSGLLANRSGDEHAQRRESWADMQKPDGLTSFFSGLVNKGTGAEKK